MTAAAAVPLLDRSHRKPGIGFPVVFEGRARRGTDDVDDEAWAAGHDGENVVRHTVCLRGENNTRNSRAKT